MSQIEPDQSKRMQQLRSIAGQVVVAAISFFLTAVIWEVIADRLNARPAVPEPFKTKLDLYFNSGPYDTAFIGSSRYFHGLDPQIFDAETTRLGVPTHSYNLGFDALDFHELQFLIRHVLTDPRSHLKTLFIEPSLRVRLAPGLEHSQRAITLHDKTGSGEIFEFLLKGNRDWKRKMFWLYEQAGVSAARLSNIGVLTNRYIHLQELPPELAEVDGPMGNGYSGLDPNKKLGAEVTAEAIKQMIANQADAERNGTARTLNDFEINQLSELQNLATQHGVRLILLAPPTASMEVYDEFRSITRASRMGMKIPLLSFADPVTYFDLYDPAGFTDPDHVGKTVSKRWSAYAAESFARMVLKETTDSNQKSTRSNLDKAIEPMHANTQQSSGKYERDVCKPMSNCVLAKREERG